MSDDLSVYNSPFTLDREMGYTRKEFFSLLPVTLADYAFTVTSDGASIQLERGTVEIQVGIERERRFTDLVSFPILPVNIRFTGVEPDDESNFLRNFDRHYFKGLG